MDDELEGFLLNWKIILNGFILNKGYIVIEE